MKFPLWLHLGAMRTAEFDNLTELFRKDLELCDEWLKSGKPTLGELHLINRILAKWDKTPPDELSDEELALNRKILQITDRLIAKGQYSTEETVQ
jgi:hypothetical protein